MRTRLVLALLVVSSGCSSAEQSVKPGINDSYVDADPARFVERFEREGREIYDRRHEIVAACEIEPGTDLADIGAGTGLFEPLFAEAVGPDGVVYAVDIVPEFIEHIDARMAAAGIENVRGVLCTERSVELPPDSVDMVFICDTYHHFEYPRSTMASVAAAMRPGGTLVIVDFERIPGESSDWVLDHVRAGKETFLAELESFGFEFVDEVDLLESNYIVRLRRPGGS